MDKKIAKNKITLIEMQDTDQHNALAEVFDVISQYKLAHSLDRSPTTVSAWKRKKIKIDEDLVCWKTAYKIEDVSNIKGIAVRLAPSIKKLKINKKSIDIL